MYELFIKKDDVVYPYRVPALFEYYKNAYFKEINKVTRYYHNRTYAIKNEHLLCRFLNQLNLPLRSDVEVVSKRVRDRGVYIARELGITSDIYKGVVHDGTFYGEGSSEILLYRDTVIIPSSLEPYWKILRPIKIHLHQKSDLELLLPNGKKTSTGDGLATISIHPELLAIQYYYFNKYQTLNITDNSPRLSIQHFILTYAIPNALYSQTDLCILNRMMHLFYQDTTGTPLAKHRFPIHDYKGHVDRLLKEIINLIRDRNIDYVTAFRMIPSISKDNCLTSLMMPESMETRQIHWANILTRLPYIKFMIELVGPKGIHQNRDHINHLQRTIRNLNQLDVYRTLLPSEEFIKYTQMTEYLLNL